MWVQHEHAHAHLHTAAEPLAERAQHDAPGALTLGAFDPERLRVAIEQRIAIEGAP